MGLLDKLILAVSRDNTPVQGFAPRSIQTGVTTLNTTAIGAIRVSVDSEYYINAASTLKATMLAGSITVIDGTVNQIVFTNSTVIEVM